MIFEHYRKWVKNLARDDGGRITRLYGGSRTQFGHRMSTERVLLWEKPRIT